MAVTAKIEAIDRDVELLIQDHLSPKAQSAVLARAAKEQLAWGENKNHLVLGRIPPHTTSVDGARDGKEEDVRPDGTIFYEFDLLLDLFKWIEDQLQKQSPVLTGTYQRSFVFYADGVEIAVGGQIPSNASEFVFLNSTPYTRKIEKWYGVFESVAALARGRFGNQAKIQFVFRAPVGGRFLTARQGGNKSGNRVPGIAITLK